MALKLQQKFLISSIATFPVACGAMLIDAQQRYDQSNDFPIILLGGMCLIALGLLGVLLCAVFWKWPSP